MADLTDMGLLYAPHVSAGRLPTETGLRLFVDGLMQIGNLTEEERRTLDIANTDTDGGSILEQAAARLSGLTQSASLVVAPKNRSADPSMWSLFQRPPAKRSQYWFLRGVRLKTAL